ncbi:MAG TPA: flagellar hook-associated protein 3 [Chromatiales bacterium]|nr:flagellar hook-associated protein 3 [Chromatiales bacterium]
MFRISTHMLFDRAISAMLDQQARVGKTQLHISTGKRILAPSDDPAGAARVLDLDRAVGMVEQFQTNADRAKSRLEYEETILNGVNNLLLRAHELGIQANNDVMSADQRKAIGAEVRHLAEELLSLANTKDANNEYVFAGYKADTRPFENLGGGQYAYRGDDGQRRIRISHDRQIADGDNGLRVFMNIPVSTGGARSAFETLDGMATALESGGKPEAYIDDVQLIMDRILTVRASIGGRLNNIDEQVDVNSNFLLTMEVERSKEEDLDYAKAISQFERQLVALQGAQKSYAQIQGLSLFNYL